MPRGRLPHTGKFNSLLRLLSLTKIRLMGALSNNGRKLANYAGFYKGIQSAGNAIAAAIDTAKVPYMSEFGANWGLLAGSLLIAAPVIWMKVQDTTPIEEDLQFTDETKADVLPMTGAMPGAEGKMSEKMMA